MFCSLFRVLELEKKKETVQTKVKYSEQFLSRVKSTKENKKHTDKIESKTSDDDDDDDDVSDIDEYLDWRSKKAYK